MNRQTPDIIRSAGGIHAPAVRLAMLVSMAARVDWPLLRSARLQLMPGIDASVEADLWHGPLIAHPATDGFILRTDALLWLRERLAETDENQTLLTAAGNLMLVQHRHLPPALRLEEELTYLALYREDHDAYLSNEQLERRLGQVVQALRDPNRRDMIYWVDRALERMPLRVRKLEAAALLRRSLRAWSDASGVWINLGIGHSKLEDWSALLVNRSSRRIPFTIRLAEEFLEIAGPDVVTPDPLRTILALPDTDPLLVEASWKEEGERQSAVLILKSDRTLRIRVGPEIRLRLTDGTRFAIHPGSSQTEKDPEITELELISEVQRKLTELGYGDLTIDGIVGARTRRAVRLFQQEQNVVITGRVTNELVERLRKTIPGRPELEMPEMKDSRIKIFLSHRHADAELAANFRDAIRLLGGPNVEVFDSSGLPESLELGKRWYEEIVSLLSDTDLLIILWGLQEEDQGWMLYETGAFLGQDLQTNRRSIIVTPPELSPPVPLSHIQAITADQEGLSRFFEMLVMGTDLTGSGKPLNPQVPRRALEAEAGRLADLFKQHSSVTERVTDFSLRFQLIVPDATNLSNGAAIPTDAVVRGSARVLELFGSIRSETTFSDLLLSTDNGGGPWLDQLTQALGAAVSNRIPSPIYSSIHFNRFAKNYRPVLDRYRLNSDGSGKFDILLIEEIPRLIEKKVTNRSLTLLRYLTSVINYRKEVLKPFSGRNLVSEEIAAFRAKLENHEKEQSELGFLDPGTFSDLFDKESNEEILEQFQRWYTLRKKLYAAIASLEIESVQQLISEALEMSEQSLELVSYQLAASLEDVAREE